MRPTMVATARVVTASASARPAEDWTSSLINHYLAARAGVPAAGRECPDPPIATILSNMATASPEETVRRIVDAFNSRDLLEFARLVAPDVQIAPMRAAIDGTVYRGREGGLQFFADSDEAWERLEIEVEEIRTVDAETLLVFGTVRGLGRGSGASVETELACVARFRNGLVTSAVTYPTRRQAFDDVDLSE
jgi:ketosteroid isomerase-like protein